MPAQDPAAIVAIDNEHLVKMDAPLQKILFDSKFITAGSIKNLVTAGIITVDMFYMLGNSESAQMAQTNLGRSLG